MSGEGPELEREIPREHFTSPDGVELLEVTWPEPAKPPRLEMADDHRDPLERDEDAEWLEPDDPRRREVERRRRDRDA